MPTYRITAPDGKSYDVTAPDGASQDEVLAYAQRSFKMAAAPKTEAPAKPFGQQLNDFISDAPRQVGLAGRYALEGVGGALDTLAAPFRAGLNALGANIQGGSGEALANVVGLPKPQTAQERLVGDAARLVASGALPIGAGAALATRGTGTAANVGRVLASNPGQQLASAGAAGAAGGYTRETGGNEGSQLAASLIAGVAAPFAVGGAQRAANAVRGAASARAAQQPVQIDVTINNALQDSGLKLADLPADVARSIRGDVQQALQISPNLSDDAVRRLADYRLTGLTPTRASLTLNPADVTRQKNLAKVGANSTDPAAQQLAEVQNQNNRALVQNLNDLGAAQAGGQVDAAQRIMGALSARNQQAKTAIDTAYAAARDSQGRAAFLDPAAFTREADDLLKHQLLQGKLPSDIRQLLNGTAAGDIPFTVDVAEQFKTRLAEAARDASRAGDGSTAKAVGLVRQALENTPLQAGQDIGQQSIDAFNKARQLNRAWAQTVERTPALQAVRDGMEPDKFVQQYITGNGSKASIMDVAQLKAAIRDNPEALQVVKDQVTAYLKNQATGGAADEVANFSQSAFNKALRGIGDQKLKLFFDPEEIARLKAVGRVASYEQVQPVGAAVNNSNTAGAVGGLLERIGGSALLGKVPFGRAAIGEPLQNIVIGQQAGRALSAPRALIGAPVQPIPTAPRSLVLSPAAFILPGEEER